MRGDSLTPIEVGWVRGGDWAATQTALTMLSQRGALRSTRPGSIERLSFTARDLEPFERTLSSSLYGPTGPRELMNKPRVRAALRDLRRTLSAAGLIRPPARRMLTVLISITVPALLLAQLLSSDIVTAPVGLPAALGLACLGCTFASRRTLAGRRTLRALRARYADLRGPGDPATMTPHETGMAAALFGDAAITAITAITAILPGTADSTGLLHGGTWSRSTPQAAETPIQDPGSGY